tara:strand:- start:182 stop:676 length:495 start_codon:yes stop_codon:yes gene_type:complete
MIDQSFNREIPGESLTAELGSRPWQQPPELTTVDEAAEYYITRIASDDFAKNLIHTMKTGVPLTVIANSVQLAGVMEGKHSADVGILMLPVIMETMMLIGDSANVDYDTGLKPDAALNPDTIAVDTITRMGNGVVEDTVPAEEPVETVEDVQEEQPTGLMARRG